MSYDLPAAVSSQVSAISLPIWEAVAYYIENEVSASKSVTGIKIKHYSGQTLDWLPDGKNPHRLEIESHYRWQTVDLIFTNHIFSFLRYSMSFCIKATDLSRPPIDFSTLPRAGFLLRQNRVRPSMLDGTLKLVLDCMLGI